MRRTCLRFQGFFQNLKKGTDKYNLFTSLWNKPDTKDERIKEYIPEVLEESLQEQRRVIQESTTRDVIVESGHRILSEIEKKSPTPSILPHLSKIILEYGAKNIIALRPLSYLLYPSGLMSSNDRQPHDLILNFVDNFRSLIEEVEQNGCSARLSKAPSRIISAEGEPSQTPLFLSQTKDDNKGEECEEKDEKTARMALNTGLMNSTALNETNLLNEPCDNADESSRETKHPPNAFYAEPTDITLFVQVITGMALANLHCGDIPNAIHCVEIGINHVVDPTRRGALFGLKAGLLVRQKKFKEAVEIAKLAVEASDNPQGYLHGGYALRRLNAPNEAMALLEKGVENHPMNTRIVAQLEAAEKEVRLLLPVSKGDTNGS
ncbi:unnamed protein product [Phytomonas sp. Hart1]|nr:unnamed protein product [Phytomonas sp. Hart1]|eukprot:CCW69477.1 unnamed protein product [Phytomonas sp. isolate Hart1]